MSSFSIVIIPELVQLPLKVRRVPKGDLIEQLAADGSDQSFNEGV